MSCISKHCVLGGLFGEIYMEYRGKEIGHIEILRAYLLQMIIMIFHMDNAGQKQSGELYKNQAVNFVKQYIRDHYKEIISIQNLAEQVNLNTDYLGRVFKKQTGITISCAIQKTRVEAACRLLNTTDSSIAEIAFNSGFEDVSFFYIIFKKYMGISPNIYRQHMKDWGSSINEKH